MKHQEDLIRMANIIIKAAEAGFTFDPFESLEEISNFAEFHIKNMQKTENRPTETRVYGINIDELDINLSEVEDMEFIEIAEQQGYVFSLKGFESYFNESEVHPLIIRILEV